MRIAIVEDDARTRRQTADYFRRYQARSGERFDIDEFSDGAALMDGYRPVYDMIFMDIEMAGMNGLDAAAAVRRLDENVLIVFLTNMGGYAIRGYDVQASDYILKPLSYELFEGKMAALTRRAKAAQPRDLVITAGETVYRLSSARLLYVEVRNHRLTLHLSDGAIEAWGSLKAIEAQLEGKGFAKCNSCYLVNLRHVDRVEKNDVIVGGDALQISRPRRREFMQAIADYLGG